MALEQFSSYPIHPFRVGRDDGDGLFETAPTVKNIDTTVTIVTLYSVGSKWSFTFRPLCVRLLSYRM